MTDQAAAPLDFAAPVGSLSRRGLEQRAVEIGRELHSGRGDGELAMYLLANVARAGADKRIACSHIAVLAGVQPELLARWVNPQRPNQQLQLGV